MLNIYSGNSQLICVLTEKGNTVKTQETLVTTEDINNQESTNHFDSAGTLVISISAN
jgi:hypothetical protein